MKKILLIFLLVLQSIPSLSEAAMQLIERMQATQVGDYIVTAMDNNYTVLIIRSNIPSDHRLSFEEISVPASRIALNTPTWRGWRQWIEAGAQGNTSWLVYTIDTARGETVQLYSCNQQRALPITSTNQFLSKLLHLSFERLPKKDTKRIGPPPPQGSNDSRRHWSPQMIYEGKVISNVAFQAWKTRWPNDGGELSGKVITVYTPKISNDYPAYFPYWLEVQGLVGKAKIRIVDSGRGLNPNRGETF